MVGKLYKLRNRDEKDWKNSETQWLCDNNQQSNMSLESKREIKKEKKFWKNNDQEIVKFFVNYKPIAPRSSTNPNEDNHIHIQVTRNRS